MYPEIYDDSLEPIYLFQPLNDPNHLIIIRHFEFVFKSKFKDLFLL